MCGIHNNTNKNCLIINKLKKLVIRFMKKHSTLHQLLCMYLSILNNKSSLINASEECVCEFHVHVKGLFMIMYVLCYVCM